MWPGFLWYILLKKMTRIGLSKLFRSFHGLSSTFVYLGEELPKIQKTGKLSRNTEIKKILFFYQHILCLFTVYYAFYAMQEHTSWTHFFILHVYKCNIDWIFNIFWTLKLSVVFSVSRLRYISNDGIQFKPVGAVINVFKKMSLLSYKL